MKTDGDELLTRNSRIGTACEDYILIVFPRRVVVVVDVVDRSCTGKSDG